MWAPGAYKAAGRVTLPAPNIGIERYFFDVADTILSHIRSSRNTAILPQRVGPIADVLYSAAGNSADEQYYNRGIIAYSFEAGAQRRRRATLAHPPLAGAAAGQPHQRAVALACAVAARLLHTIKFVTLEADRRRGRADGDEGDAEAAPVHRRGTNARAVPAPGVGGRACGLRRRRVPRRRREKAPATGLPASGSPLPQPRWPRATGDRARGNDRVGADTLDTRRAGLRPLRSRRAGKAHRGAYSKTFTFTLSTTTP